MKNSLVKKDECTYEVISKMKNGGYRHVRWERREKNNYVLFNRQFAPGYPLLEVLLNPPSPITEVNCSPVYYEYLFDPVQLDTGLSVRLNEDGFFGVTFHKKPIFPETEYFVTDKGVYPFKERDSDFHTKIGDAEPHNYRVESVLDVKNEVYHLKYYRDGKLKRKETIGMTEIFSACPRVTDKKLLKLFEILEKNMEELKKNLILSTLIEMDGHYWNMADGIVQKAIPCPCSMTGHNGTVKFLNFYQNDLFFDGREVYKVCHVCGRNEKLF